MNSSTRECAYFISLRSAKSNEPSSCNDDYESKKVGQRTYKSPTTPIRVTQSSKNDIILDGRNWIVEPRDGMKKPRECPN